MLYGEGGKEGRDQKYAAAMGDLHAQFPDDVNLASFYALALLGSAEQGRDFAIYMRAAAVLEEVFPKNQMHPGVVHYLIHCYDDPIHAPLGLRAARIYAQIAPEAGHAQHMTSHIFLALGMWDDVVQANQTAIAVVNRKRAEMHRPPHFCGHYASWLAYGYLQQGRIPEARRMLEGCRDEALEQAKRMANRPVASPDADNSAAGSFAEMRAHFLIDSQLWDDEVASWPLPGGADVFTQLTFDYTNALVAFHKGDLTGAREFSTRVEADRKLAQAWLDKHKSEEPNDAKRLGIMSDQLLALVAPQNASEQTIKALREIAEREHALPLEFGPPDIPAPTSELLGETLLRLHHAAEARSAFEADLAGAPGRRLAALGLAAAGNDPAAAHGTDTAKDKAKDAHVHQ